MTDTEHSAPDVRATVPASTARPSGRSCDAGTFGLATSVRRSSARGVHHVALLSSDVETTIGFYQGCSSSRSPSCSRTGTTRARPTSSSTSATATRFAFFDLPGLDLGPYAEVLGGLHHLAISVERERWERLRTRLADAGVALHEVGGTSLYFSGPDGERIELIADPLGEMYGSAVV